MTDNYWGSVDPTVITLKIHDRIDDASQPLVLFAPFRDAAMLPVVPYVGEQLALTLAEMKYAGFAVSVFFIRDRNGFEDAAALLAPHNIHVFHIREESDLHELAPQRIGQ